MNAMTTMMTIRLRVAADLMMMTVLWQAQLAGFCLVAAAASATPAGAAAALPEHWAEEADHGVGRAQVLLQRQHRDIRGRAAAVALLQPTLTAAAAVPATMALTQIVTAATTMTMPQRAAQMAAPPVTAGLSEADFSALSTRKAPWEVDLPLRLLLRGLLRRLLRRLLAKRNRRRSGGNSVSVASTAVLLSSCRKSSGTQMSSSFHCSKRAAHRREPSWCSRIRPPQPSSSVRSPAALTAAILAAAAWALTGAAASASRIQVRASRLAELSL